ncbi:hypothetical protein J7481_25355 [Labrenzia sp. R4_2]|uniref:hypothetical protein n=1 Tax=Labrenzia sp. R4_2 TaxID=2821107 RepID=UPI001ADB17C0|nr:hypothetical protein [Labrenzia sp. R4_2]MBO9422858.1 hypothetical protein [Labrenzia sp. R4_2]
MTKPLTRDTLFKPKKPTAATKAEITKQVSMDLTQVETDLRNAKTAKLKQARLERDAREAEEAKAVAASKPVKPAKSRKR